MSLKVEIIRPRPFRWIKSRRRKAFDIYKELVRPVKFLARKRSLRIRILKD